MEGNHNGNGTHFDKQYGLQGTEPVLLVEGDINVREATRSILNENVYKILVQENGQIAFDKYWKHQKK